MPSSENRKGQKFEWAWPHSMDVKLPSISGEELLLGPHRVFRLRSDHQSDLIAWGGFDLVMASDILEPRLIPPLIAALLMYISRRSLQEYRAPLRGLRAAYRESKEKTFAEVLLGSKKEASARIRRNSPEFWSDSFERFRKGFANGLRRELLSILPLNPASQSISSSPIPPVVTTLFGLPSWGPKHHIAVRRILLDVGAHIAKWPGRKKRPSDPRKWMCDQFSHPGTPPLNASREELAAAVAASTWIAQSFCHPYGMLCFALQIRPRLSKTELELFSLCHFNSTCGIPFGCIRRDVVDYLTPILGEIVHHRDRPANLKPRTAQLLGLISTLMDEIHDRDRTRKSDPKLKQLIERAQREDRGRIRKTTEHSSDHAGGDDW